MWNVYGKCIHLWFDMASKQWKLFRAPDNTNDMHTCANFRKSFVILIETNNHQAQSHIYFEHIAIFASFSLLHVAVLEIHPMLQFVFSVLRIKGSMHIYSLDHNTCTHKTKRQTFSFSYIFMLRQWQKKRNSR